MPNLSDGVKEALHSPLPCQHNKLPTLCVLFAYSSLFFPLSLSMFLSLLHSTTGLTWQHVSHPSLTGFDSRGTFLDSSTSPPTLYHATPGGIYSWPDGQPEALQVLVSSGGGAGGGGVHSFAAGRSAAGGLTLAYVDKDVAFCQQVRVVVCICMCVLVQRMCVCLMV